MSRETLQAIVGTALVDREFAQQLLHRTPEALRRFNLTEDEYRTVAAIRASSLEQFAGQLDRLLSREEREVELRLQLGSSKRGTRCYTVVAC